jgi:hypothetical protein
MTSVVSRRVLFLVAGLQVAGFQAGPAFAVECVGLSKMTYTGGMLRQIVDTLLGGPTSEASCGSLESVVGKIARQNKVGGRRLEKDRPLNPAEAQANLAAAEKNPAVRARLERVAKEVQDEKVRAVYEAAILDEEGFYAARDLKIRELQEVLK